MLEFSCTLKYNNEEKRFYYEGKLVRKFSDKKDEFRLNICMNLREKMDEDRKNLVEKLLI